MAQRKKSTFERLTSGKLSQKERKELKRRLYSDHPGLEVVHQNVAGMDVGNESHHVAVAPGCDAHPVQEFGSWTADLMRMVEWLKGCGVQHVVMQSTGEYWIALYDILEQAGMQVCLTNARETKNLPGRKSDVQESQWLLKLHTHGLLRNSFRPAEEIRTVRTVWRLRQRHVQEAARCIQHMHKSLTAMNVQLANAISDVSGVTGQAIIRAILQGERNPYELAKLRDYRIRASEEEVARSLEGNWREDGLFELQQAVDAYDFWQKQLRECDVQLQKYLGRLPSRSIESRPEATCAGHSSAGEPGSKNKKGDRKPRPQNPKFHLEEELRRICGVNLTRIDGIDVITVQTFVAEVGVDMTAWRSEDHLVSWLKLCPQRQISGGKLIKVERSKVKSRAAEALRMAASSLLASNSYLGARFRYLRARRGPKKAIKAMAAYLARLIYRMLTRGEAWVDRGAQEYEDRRVRRERQLLERKAAELGLRLTSAA